MRQSLLALGILSAFAAPLRAQCPDGTPPPCRATPRAAPAEETSTFDSSTALVVPLTPVGSDTSLRSLAATEHLAYYAPALKLEAEMLAALGRHEEAVAKLEEYVELRASADDELQSEVADARRQLAELYRARQR